MEKLNKIVLCAPCCSNCPEVTVNGDTVTITDDNDMATVGIRTVKLTKDQFKMILSDGQKLI